MELSKSFISYINSENIAGRTYKNPTYTYKQNQNITDGVLVRPLWRIPTSALRNAATGTSLISAIHTVRVDFLHRFARINKKEGLWFRTEDPDDELTDEMETEMRETGKWFERMGDLIDGWQSRDNLYTVFEMMIRDTLTIDSVCFYLVWNSLSKLIELKYLDPATIFACDPKKGYRGDKGIAFVQMIDDDVVETFTSNEILLTHKNHMSDVNMRGFGFSPLEACILDLSGIVNALKLNRKMFERNILPGFASLSADMSEDAVESLNTQFREMFSDLENSGKVPFIASSAGEIKWTPLNLPSDMMLEKFMQWGTLFVLSAHGMDQAELGLHLNSGQNQYEANQIDKAVHSMTRANKSLLSNAENIFNTLLTLKGVESPFVCYIAGQDPEDELAKLNKEKDEVQNWKLIDEVRIENDLPPLGEKMAELYGVDESKYKLAGAIVLNTVFQQNLSGISAASTDSPEEEPDSFNKKDEDYYDPDLAM
nr:phage portal protein [Leptospira inadai]